MVEQSLSTANFLKEIVNFGSSRSNQGILHHFCLALSEQPEKAARLDSAPRMMLREFFSRESTLKNSNIQQVPASQQGETALSTLEESGTPTKRTPKKGQEILEPMMTRSRTKAAEEREKAVRESQPSIPPDAVEENTKTGADVAEVLVKVMEDLLEEVFKDDENATRKSLQSIFKKVSGTAMKRIRCKSCENDHISYYRTLCLDAVNSLSNTEGKGTWVRDDLFSSFLALGDQKSTESICCEKFCCAGGGTVQWVQLPMYAFLNMQVSEGNGTFLNPVFTLGEVRLPSPFGGGDVTLTPIGISQYHTIEHFTTHVLITPPMRATWRHVDDNDVTSSLLTRRRRIENARTILVKLNADRVASRAQSLTVLTIESDLNANDGSGGEGVDYLLCGDNSPTNTLNASLHASSANGSPRKGEEARKRKRVELMQHCKENVDDDPLEVEYISSGRSNVGLVLGF
jgi:hypothetical protein